MPRQNFSHFVSRNLLNSAWLRLHTHPAIPQIFSG
jgi:hypothetical protein